MFDNDASNSGGADDGLINPAGFVVRAGDLDTSAITAAASGVAGIGTGVVGAVDSVSTAWTTVKAPGVFETPDAGAVYTLMDPAVAGAADMNGVTSRISSALETYAAELEAIKPDLEDIEQDAWDFRSEALAGYEVTNIEARGWLGSFTTGIDGNPVMMDDSYETTTISWREHDPAVAKNEKLVHRFEAILARVSTAATTCANAIQAELQLVCAAPFDAITAEALANSPEFSTWGAAVGEQRNVSESIGFGLANFGKGIWTGGELLTGYDAQTGVRSWDTFWKTVGGLGDFVGSTLAVTSIPFMIAGFASLGTNSPFRDFFTDRINTVASSWGSIVGWDQQAHLAGENGWHKWEEDGIAAATESVANVGTFFIPVANIGKVVVVGTKVGSFIVRGVAGVAEFVVPAGSHLVTGVAKVVELTSTGVKTGFRGLIDAIRDTHLNVTVKPTTVPGSFNTALDVTHIDVAVKPGTAVSDALGLEQTSPRSGPGGQAELAVPDVVHSHAVTDIDASPLSREVVDDPANPRYNPDPYGHAGPVPRPIGPMYSNADSATSDGWARVLDEDVTPSGYGLPQASHGEVQPYYQKPATVTNPDVQKLIEHPEAPYGWDENGVALDKAGWDERYALPNRADGTPGGVNWPGNGGAVNGSRVRYDSIEALLRDYPEFKNLDRLGGNGGDYLAVRGTPFEQRGLTPGHTAFTYTQYALTGHLPAHIRPEVSIVARANGFPGGGWQIRFWDLSTNRWVSIEDLLEGFQVIR